MNNKDLLDKTRITNSPSISGGGYVISAEQLNPDIEGSLANKIKNNKNDKDLFTRGIFSGMCGNHGVSGYIRFMTIKVVADYINYPFWFILGARNWIVPVTFSIMFKNNNSGNPGISSFTYMGKLSTNVFIHKPNDNEPVYDIYCTKSESYASLNVFGYGGHKIFICGSFIDIINVTLKDEQVNVMPENIISPTNCLQLDPEIISIKNRLTALENK